MFIARLERAAGRPAGARGPLVGIGAFIVTLIVVRRARDLERYRYTFALVGIGLLLLPLVPGVGSRVNGARIWVCLGPISFQPGEFAKIVLAIFFASYLVEKRELLAHGDSFRIGPFACPTRSTSARCCSPGASRSS